jgi:SAM-dependent methyltransferase
MNTREEASKKLFEKNELGQYWNNLYSEVRHCRDLHFVQRLELVSELITQKFPKGVRVLDLGCGAGVLSERLVAAGHQVDAVDQSPDMLEFTRERLKPCDASRYRVTLAECASLPFPDAAFDVVACIGVFGYMDDVDSAIKEIRRVLRPGGTLVMSIRNLDHVTVFDGFHWLKQPLVALPKALARRLGWWREDKHGGIEIFDRPSKVVGTFESFGFSLRDFLGAGYGPPTFLGQPVLPESAAKRLSQALSRWATAWGIQHKAKWFADISIYQFSLNAQALNPQAARHG